MHTPDGRSVVTSSSLVNRPPSLPPRLHLCSPILARRVDRVNRVKSTRHASRSNRLTRDEPYMGEPSRPNRHPFGMCHRWPLASLLSRLKTENIMVVKFIFFLVERCDQPRHSPNYATRERSSCRSLSLGGCKSVLAPRMESGAERRRGRKQRRCKGVVFRFYVGRNLRPT